MMITIIKRVANIFLKAYHVSPFQVNFKSVYSVSNPRPIRCNLQLFQFCSPGN